MSRLLGNVSSASLFDEVAYGATGLCTDFVKANCLDLNFFLYVNDTLVSLFSLARKLALVEDADGNYPAMTIIQKVKACLGQDFFSNLILDALNTILGNGATKNNIVLGNGATEPCSYISQPVSYLRVLLSTNGFLPGMCNSVTSKIEAGLMQCVADANNATSTIVLNVIIFIVAILIALIVAFPTLGVAIIISCGEGCAGIGNGIQNVCAGIGNGFRNASASVKDCSASVANTFFGLFKSKDRSQGAGVSRNPEENPSPTRVIEMQDRDTQPAIFDIKTCVP